MKKIIAVLLAVFGPVSNVFAGIASGFSTFQVSWSAASPTAVPTMSTLATVLLAVLLALVVYRVSRNRGLLVRAIAPLATLGVIASLTVITESPIAGAPSSSPPVDASSCSGTQTYTANEFTEPPCFSNSCGVPVTVSYTLIAGETPEGAPITEGSCTLEYYCSPADSNAATQGAIIPSDETPYGTAYCAEIFFSIE